jgi:predicted site-specific integrase-resolvase
MSTTQKITLEAWAQPQFSPPPSLHTLRRWARDCWIYPVPEKVGRTYYVERHARFIGRDHSKIADVT